MYSAAILALKTNRRLQVGLAALSEYHDNLTALQKVSNLNILITIIKLISFLSLKVFSYD